MRYGAPGPITVPFGKEKVTFTIKADGYAPKDVDVIPNTSSTVPATLTKLGPIGGQTKHKDFDNPF